MVCNYFFCYVLPFFIWNFQHNKEFVNNCWWKCYMMPKTYKFPCLSRCINLRSLIHCLSGSVSDSDPTSCLLTTSTAGMWPSLRLGMKTVLLSSAEVLDSSTGDLCSALWLISLSSWSSRVLMTVLPTFCPSFWSCNSNGSRWGCILCCCWKFASCIGFSTAWLCPFNSKWWRKNRIAFCKEGRIIITIHSDNCRHIPVLEANGIGTVGTRIVH